VVTDRMTLVASSIRAALARSPSLTMV